MASVAINSSVNVNIDFELAGIEKRLPAWIADFVIRILYLYICSKFISSRDYDKTVDVLIELAIILPIFLYYIFFEIVMNGQTPGKMIFKIKVVSLEGYKPNYIQYLNRWVFRLLDTGFLTLFIFGFLSSWVYGSVFAVANIVSIIFFINSKKQQRIGDMIADTVVIRLTSKTKIEDTIFTEIANKNYKVTYPQVIKLSDRDISIIKDAIRAAEKNGKYYMLDNIANKLVHALQINHNGDSYHLLQTLVHDFNFITTN